MGRRPTGIREGILTLLADRPAGLCTGDIAKALQMERSNVTTYLGKLFHEGLIQRSKGGGRKAVAGMKERTWRLPPPGVRLTEGEIGQLCAPDSEETRY